MSTTYPSTTLCAAALTLALTLLLGGCAARAGHPASDERARLGADLHDGVLQILSSVQLYARELRVSLEALQPSATPDGMSAVEEVLTHLERCVQLGSAEIVTAIAHLRRPQPALDITAHVEMMRRRLQERGISSDVTCELGDVVPEVADALAWILREAGSNILQHSLANHVAIELRHVGGDITMKVADDGIGATAPAAEVRSGSDLHLGRRIMRERAAHVGGHLRVTRGERGTTVHVRMPATPIETTAPDPPLE